MIRLVCLLIGYAVGCIQTAYIVGRITKNIDIREHGSGNAGASNIQRVIGSKAGLMVFVLDVLKAIAGFTAGALLFHGGGSFFPAGLPLEPGLYAGLGVLIGHNFPFFLKFKGGKGIASTLGVMLALDWRAALGVYLIGLAVLYATKYISLASLTMTLIFPLLIWFRISYNAEINAEIIAISFLMTAMAFFLHRGNIQRLLAGTERKLSFPWSKQKLNH